MSVRALRKSSIVAGLVIWGGNDSGGESPRL
jgi:hypothetical protein